MDTVNKILVAICLLQMAYICAAHFFYSREIHKLLDKLMSRDYQTYHSVTAPPKKQDKIQVPLEVPEDLRVLQGFQLP